MSCKCEKCMPFEPLDVCSSDCDTACAAKDHCNRVNDNYCLCKSCQAHDLDETKPQDYNDMSL